MRFTKVIGIIVSLTVLVFACTTSVFAASNSFNGDIIVETEGYVPNDVLSVWTPECVLELPSDFPDDWVGGFDDRTLISDTTVKPYLSIVALKMTFPSGVASGTGFMVSRNCMVTAAHNMVGSKQPMKGEAVQSIEIYFGVYKLNGKNYCTYRKTVTPDTALFYHDPNYTGYGGSEYDYGFIKFSSDLEWDVGWWGLRAQSTSSLVGTNITVTGYENLAMKTHSGNIMSLYGGQGNNAVFRHSADTDGGQSGSPVYVSDNKVVGIHIEGFNYPDVYNAAWRITPDFIYTLVDYGCVTLAN